MYCDGCIARSKLRNCGQCGEEFCWAHGCSVKSECCSLFLCKDCEEDEDGEHNSKKIDCGHRECGYYKKPKCRKCSKKEEERKKKVEEGLMRQDLPLVENLLENSKSSSLKEALESWLSNVPRGGRQKRASADSSATKRNKKGRLGK